MTENKTANDLIIEAMRRMSRPSLTGKKQIIIYIPRDLHNEIYELSVSRKTTMKKIIHEAMNSILYQHEKKTYSYRSSNPQDCFSRRSKKDRATKKQSENQRFNVEVSEDMYWDLQKVAANKRTKLSDTIIDAVKGFVALTVAGQAEKLPKTAASAAQPTAALRNALHPVSGGAGSAQAAHRPS